MRQFGCGLGAAVALFASPFANAQVMYRTVALSGRPAPGTAAGVNWGNFSNPVVNTSGACAFEGNLNLLGPGVTFENWTGFWVETTPGQISLGQRAGSDVPTLSGVRYQSATAWLPHPSNGGQIAFVCTFVGEGVTPSNNSGVVAGGLGMFDPRRLVQRMGNQAPGCPVGVVFSSAPAIVRVGHSGEVVFSNFLTGSGVGATNNNGIWEERNGALQLIARTGDLAPGTTDTFQVFGPPRCSQQAGVVFASATTNPASSGIWRSRAGVVEAIVLPGIQAPGFPPGITFRFVANPATNAAGDIVFHATLQGPGVQFNNEQSIWVRRADGLYRLVARQGNSAPGPGLPFTSLANIGGLAINAHGRVAFSATAGSRGLWAEDASGNVQFIVRSGDPAPGEAQGVSFGNFSTTPFGQYDDLGFNARGQAFFYATVAGPGITNSSNRSIYVWSGPGRLEKIVRLGQQFDVNDDPNAQDLRTVFLLGTSSIQQSTGGEDGVARGFTDEGEVFFDLSFPNNTSGIFAARVPPPGCAIDLDDGSRSGTPDEAVTIDDLIYFLIGFEAGDSRVDLDNDGDPESNVRDGAVTIEDLLFMVSRFERGC